MPPDDPFASLGTDRPARKPTKKPHWKDKLFSRDKNNHYSADKQIEAFLGPTRSNTDLACPEPAPKAFAAANLDVPRKWRSMRNVSSRSPVPDPSSSDNIPVANPPKPRKSRARKGLRVGFTSQVPEIIGEGGDEADTPAIEISRRRARRQIRGPTAPTEASGPENEPSAPAPQLRVETSLEDLPHRSNQPRDIREGSSVQDRKPPLTHNPQEAELLMSLSPGDGSSRLSFRSSPESSTLAQQARAKMHAEEGRALQHRYEDPPSPPSPPSPPDDEPNPRPSSVASPRSPDSMYETPPTSVTGNVSAYSAYRPQASPVMRAPTNLSSVDSSLLPSLTPGSNASKLPSPNAPSVSPEVALDMQSPSTSGSGKPSPRPPKVSPHSTASQSGGTEFNDFKAYITRYAGLIGLSAESIKPLMETSLAEWIRASLWWFLRGKKTLETYARSRSHSAGDVGRTPSGSAKQAVIDLGKALWINENIVPQHEELTRYGDMSVDALLTLVSTNGDKQMVDLVNLHQAVINHIRGLALSIKRNNILDAVEQSEGSADQVDTGVWIRYPFFAPDVSAILSGAATRSMLIDNIGKRPTITQMMPLGDTGRYFTYGSMFVQVCISSSEDDVQQFPMPCVLSIIRERADWYVYAAISSQSELVNVMIQPDRKQGPTWDDVDWVVRSHSMRVKLHRGFELDVVFQEDDFRMIWNIVKYTLKAEASLLPEAGESLAYESTLKVFHYMDPGKTRAFPPDPFERCRIRLFERSVPVTEGTGTRNVHQGFRLAVLTSPKVKTLSTVGHILGYGAPVVFGLLRGEDGAPALMLKVKEEGRMRSMLMTFYEVPERTKMHSLLLGMRPLEREVKTSDFELRSYAIEQPADKASGGFAASPLQFPAGSVAVIDQEHDYVDHGYGPTILSEHLRAFIATEWGSVTDRINLGMTLAGLQTSLTVVGPGELKLGLDVNKPTSLSLYRPPQRDLTVSVAENLVRPEMPDTLTSFLQTVKAKPMIRRFEFASLQGMLDRGRSMTLPLRLSTL